MSRTAREKVEVAVVEYQAGRFDQARKYLEEALATDPSDAFVNYNLGNVYYRLGLYDRATSAYSKAVAGADPDLIARAQYNLGNAYFRLGDLKEAVRHYKLALKVVPDDVEAKHNLEYMIRLASGENTPGGPGGKGGDDAFGQGTGSA